MSNDNERKTPPGTLAAREHAATYGNQPIRKHSPLGMPAVSGRRGPSNLDTARTLRKLIAEHPELTTLRALEYEFEKGEVLVQEGQVSELRCAFLVIEGTLIERQNHHVRERGHVTIDICQIRQGGVAFVQALSPAYAILPATTSIVADSDGRAFLIDADWVKRFSKLDKTGLLLMAEISIRFQMVTSLVELRAANQLDRDIREMAEHIAKNDPKSIATVGSLKTMIATNLRAAKETTLELDWTRNELERVSLKEHEASVEIVRLTKELEASKAREQIAIEGSSQTYKYLEEEQARQAKASAEAWRLLETELLKAKDLNLSVELKCALLGIGPVSLTDPIGQDIAQAWEASVAEALSETKAPAEPAPMTVRSSDVPKHPRRDLPSFVDPDEEEPEPTLIGIQQPGAAVLPKAKPQRKPTLAFGGLTGLSKPALPPRPGPQKGHPPLPQQPPRSVTPLGMAAARPPHRPTMTPIGLEIPNPDDPRLPKAPKPPVAVASRYAIIAPGSARHADPPSSDGPDIETEEVGNGDRKTFPLGVGIDIDPD